jgi:phospholipase C
MTLNKRKSHLTRGCRLGLSVLALGQFSLGPALAGGTPSPADDFATYGR